GRRRGRSAGVGGDGGAGERRAPVVEARSHLPDLPALLPGHGRRRGGGPGGDRGAARLPGVAGGGRDVDLALLPVADGGLRLRRDGPPRRRSALRDAGGLRRAGRRGARARAARDPGLHPQPHLGPAPLVRGGAAVARRSQARLVHLARSGAGRRRAQQLAERLWGERVDAGRGHGAVLPALLSPPAAGPQLAQPAGGSGDARGDPLLDGARGGRRARGRRAEGDQGRRAPRRPAQPRLPPGRGRSVRRAAAHPFRRPAGGARRDRPHAARDRRVSQPRAHRRDLQRHRAADAVLRARRRRLPLPLQLPAHQAAVGRARHRRGHPALRGAPAVRRVAQLGPGQPRPAP
ncbi:MAG: GH13_23 / GH13_17 / GH13_31 / GH13_30 / GH13_ 40 / GH13_16 / GH13_29 / GH13_35 / GH13_36 / GH13 / GH13_4 / GH13_20 / GH13_2 / GH13_1 / GH13_34 / GH13 _26 / GH13_19, partial [uncultured Gemmatimonadetes bacterium]